MKVILLLLMGINTNLYAVESIAHRGASGHAPENTISAIVKAIELKADYIEIDVHMTTDGEVVAFHDEKVNRTTSGSGNIKNKSLKELRELDAGSWFHQRFKNEPIPTLGEILKLNFLDSKLIIEVKNPNNVYPSIENKISNIVKESNSDTQVIYKSFSTEVLKRFNKINPKYQTLYVTIGPLLGLFVIDDWLRVGSLFDLKFINYIQVHKYFVSKSLVEKVHKNNLKFIAWDVHNPADIKKMIEAGVDIIETDFPERVNFSLLP